MPGMSLNAKYQSDLVYKDRAAFMRLRSSGSLVINILGPIRARAPFESSYFAQSNFDQTKYNLDTYRISLLIRLSKWDCRLSRQRQDATH
jgi:hypothetical protein